MTKSHALRLAAFTYQKILRPVLFNFDAERVHETVVSLGSVLGRGSKPPETFSPLSQDLLGVRFNNPLGLAAGFDYNATLTQTLPFLGFGFGTVGTITNLPFGGNPKPRLGRLPKSKALLVNKGFKNPGADAVIRKLTGKEFALPVGISLGSRDAKAADIIAAFEKFEGVNLNHAYYEINISCPNLATRRNFYSPKTLGSLLSTVDKLKISRPIFIKMPISKTDKEILMLLEAIAKHCPSGVILGNLQKNRAFLHPSETTKFSVGNFSGLPTQERSNELIKLTYQKYKDRFIIIGCGGIFSGADAYEKIKLGASLVQLITGLVYQGPQLVAQINLELLDFLKRDGFKNISEAVGTKD